MFTATAVGVYFHQCCPPLRLLDNLTLGFEPTSMRDLRDPEQVKARDARGMTPLMWAAMDGKRFAMRELLRTDPAQISDTAQDGETALSLAAGNGHLEAVRLLLDAGADPNQQTPRGPAIHYAVVREKTDVVRLLLERGADPTLRDAGGQTAIQRLADPTSQVVIILQTAIDDSTIGSVSDAK